MQQSQPTRVMDAAQDTQRSIDCWNDILTPKWVRFRHLLSGNGKIHSDVANGRIAVPAGSRVLDIGCGFGETCLEFAERVGPTGSVLGLDCTGSFLEIAAAEAKAARTKNVSYLTADIESHELQPASFDMAYSRFGIMFCYSPVRALRNVWRALVPGGMVHLIAWRSVRDNPCWGVAEKVALQHLPPPDDGAQTCGPGPFSFAAQGTGALMLAAANFTDVTHQRIDRDVCVGTSVDEAVDYQLLVGPAGFVIREAGEAGARALPAIREELVGVYNSHTRADGSVWLPSSTWLISARK